MSDHVSTSSLYSNFDHALSIGAPDEPSGDNLPPKEFVLCRDHGGSPTAVFGEDVWDFNPYRLSGKKISRLRFNSIFKGNDAETRLLINELKYLIYCLIYRSGAGRIGVISASTIYSYYVEMVKAVKYCYSLKENRLVGLIGLGDLFSNRIYLSSFIRLNNNKVSFNKRMSALLGHLIQIGEHQLGFRVCTSENLEFGNRESKQHPVIPTAIYLQLINHWSDWLDVFYESRESLASIIKCFSDRFYGISKTRQKALGVGGAAHYRHDMKEAIEFHQLDSLLINKYELDISQKQDFAKLITNIQFVCKNVIHLYTGMRDQEVTRLKVGCLSSERLTPSVELPGVVDDGQVISIISTLAKFNEHNAGLQPQDRVVSIKSTTTKFTGYRQEAAWLASEEVVRAVKLAECIAVSLASLADESPTELEIPLFISSALIVNLDVKELVVPDFQKTIVNLVFPCINISDQDMVELRAGDPSRDFDSEKLFGVGKEWPLTSHQYRRSLAFYASSSGFVSLPSLKKQFKHLTIQMTQYYQRGFQNLKAVFGAYEEKSGRYSIPESHIAFEFQTSMTIDTAQMILNDVLGSENRLFGAVGTYIEKQRSGSKTGDIDIKMIRSETEKLVNKGELSYQATILGGCTKIGRCDEYMSAEITACIGCENSVIDEKKLAEQIAVNESDMAKCDEGSVEFRVLKLELDHMKVYQNKKVSQEARNGKR